MGCGTSTPDAPSLPVKNTGRVKAAPEAVKALHDAASAGDVERLRAVLKDNEGTPRFVDVQQYGATALHAASCNCHLEVARLLLDRGAAVDAAEQGGTTPLCISEEKGHAQVVELLKAAKATREAEANEAMRLLLARSMAQLYNMLLQHGSRAFTVVNALSQDGLACLHHAVKEGMETAVQAICYVQGANINVQSKTGVTGLTLALDQGKTGMCQLLMAHGARVDIKDFAGEPLVVRMVRMCNLQAVSFLVAESADLNATTNEGCTALHVASSLAPPSDVDYVSTLLQGGADPNAEDKAGCTPLGHAAVRGRPPP